MTTHGIVYRAIDPAGTVLYVGMTTRLDGRLKDHARGSAWWPLHDRIETDPSLPLERAFLSEANQIALLRPRFNRIGGVVERFGPDRTSQHQALEWKVRYEAGATVEEIALDARTAPQTVRKHLLAVGAEMRRPGARAGKPQLNVANASPRRASGGAAVHVAFAGTRAAHRRRHRRAA